MKKRYVFLLSILLGGMLFAKGNDIELYKYIQQDDLHQELSIGYNGSLYMIVSMYLGKASLSISDEAVVIMKNNLNKYLEWEKLAVKEKVRINKDIPNSSIKVKGSHQYLEKTYSFYDEIRFKIYSDSVKEHYLVMKGNKIILEPGYFEKDWEMDEYKLDKAAVKAMLKALSEDNLKKAKKEYIKNTESASLFN